MVLLDTRIYHAISPLSKSGIEPSLRDLIDLIPMGIAFLIREKVGGYGYIYLRRRIGNENEDHTTICNF